MWEDCPLMVQVAEDVGDRLLVNVFLLQEGNVLAVAVKVLVGSKVAVQVLLSE